MKCDKCGNHYTKTIVIDGIRREGGKHRTSCYNCVPFVPVKRIAPIKRTCKICGTIYDSTTSAKAKLTCGSPQCYKSRATSKKYLEAMSSQEHKLKSNCSPNFQNGYYHYKCSECDSEIVSQKPIRSRDRQCENCKENTVCIICNSAPIFMQLRCKECNAKHFKLNALKSLNKQSVVSKAETSLLDGLEFKVDRNNRIILDGYEIDGYAEDLNLAIDYRGPWHYREITDQKTLDNTIKRDRIKERLAKSKGIKLHPVAWALNSHHDLGIEIYILNQRLLNITPWRFEYDLDLFKTEFKRLCKSTANKYLICQNTVEWYFKHLWSYISKSHKLSAFEHWDLNSEIVIENRRKYADLSPRSLRRYYKLFDYSPSPRDRKSNSGPKSHYHHIKHEKINSL